MSIGIATGGMYNPCIIRGGAPPYRVEDKTPKVSVTKFEMKTISINRKLFENINVKLINEED